jgi:hypothetical protein
VKAARWFAGAFWSSQNACKLAHFCIGAFLSISGDLLGLLHKDQPTYSALGTNYPTRGVSADN